MSLFVRVKRPAIRRSLYIARNRAVLRFLTTAQAIEGSAGKDDAAKGAAAALVAAYQRYGHYEADLDPLKLRKIQRRHELDPSRYSSSSLLNKPLQRAADQAGAHDASSPQALAERLKQLYCGKVGFEFDHIDDAEQREWFAARVAELFGAPMGSVLSPSERKNAAMLMVEAEHFEDYLARKFSSFKRYSGEGAECMQPAMDAIFRTAKALGTSSVVVGMPHRGRLAFLVSQLKYTARRLFWKIPGRSEFGASLGDSVVDDVTSHIAASLDKELPGVKGKLHISLLHNPSHLEIVGCVAAGKTRAKQASGDKSMCIQVHGDAAMAGQGCVAETFSLANLPGFSVDGTVHVVVNNQLGFTTEDSESRSSTYATDVAKVIGAPIIHVNGESIDHVLLASRLATEYRHRFQRDVVVDLVCYRRHGHNEVDEPAFTQPVMYAEVRRTERPSPAAVYAKQLQGEGLLTNDKVEKVKKGLEAHLDAEMAASNSLDVEKEGPDHLQGKWKRMRHAKPEDLHWRIATGVPPDVLHHVGASCVVVPDTFKVHPRLQRSFIDARLKLLEQGKVDWATAEALAVGSLLGQGFDVRLCGQDAQRGTFSQRHFVLVDQETGERYCPLSHVIGSTGKLEVVNSNLSELAVLGFEFGVSWEDPRRLVMWEAQFGDFCNGAQIVIDTFMSGSEAKWLRQSGLVMLLPHGYDGAGPEHSSGRLERFLQLCDAPGVAPPDTPVPDYTGSNMIVANVTTPANYFHLLRRQQVRPFRKPLVLMTPKTLLRHPQAVSPMEDLSMGTSFHPILASTAGGAAIEPGVTPAMTNVRSVVLCTGKVYYDALKALGESGGNKQATALVRIEELAPFPTAALRKALQESLPNVENFIWLQEEPLNAGAWAFVSPHIQRILRGIKGVPVPLRYIGRPVLPTPAVGLSHAHTQQSKRMMTELVGAVSGASKRPSFSLSFV